jgi:hypothetical protein
MCQTSGSSIFSNIPKYHGPDPLAKLRFTSVVEAKKEFHWPSRGIVFVTRIRYVEEDAVDG